MAGEVEALNASKREGMSPEEKRKSLLEDTADVDPASMIYIDAEREESGESRFSVPPEEDMNVIDISEDDRIFMNHFYDPEWFKSTFGLKPELRRDDLKLHYVIPIDDAYNEAIKNRSLWDSSYLIRKVAAKKVEHAIKKVISNIENASREDLDTCIQDLGFFNSIAKKGKGKIENDRYIYKKKSEYIYALAKEYKRRGLDVGVSLRKGIWNDENVVYFRLKGGQQVSFHILMSDPNYVFYESLPVKEWDGLENAFAYNDPEEYKKMVERKRYAEKANTDAWIFTHNLEDEYIKKHGRIDTQKKLESFIKKANKELEKKGFLFRVKDNPHGIFLYNYELVPIDESVTPPPKKIYKSLDVTYDDNGDVIPLSERFNREKDDVRFSLNFKKWFKDSKVVDKDGNPLVVYRRDDELFTIFDINKTQKTDAGFLGKGFYFYGDKAQADGPAYGYGKNLRAFYLKAENPYYISQEEVNELAEANDKAKSTEFVERLKEEGYDSVYWNGDLRQEWMVFEPTQIKSATDNIGTFDAKNPDIRFSVTEEGKPAFNVQGIGQKSIQEILSDKTIAAETMILTDSGNEDWGRITDQMIQDAPADLGLKVMPIRLFKGNNGYGLVHIAKHLEDFTFADISKEIENLFGKPNKIYARRDGNIIKLEVFPKPPANWGILELREDLDCYSVITFYPRQDEHSKPKGKLIWEYSSQSVSSQAASELSKNGVAGKTPQTTQEELAAKSDSNIDPFGINSSSENKNVRFSLSAEDEGKVQAWAEVLLPVYGKKTVRNGAEAEKYLLEHGISVEDEDKILLEAACSRVQELRDEHRKRNAAMRRKASVEAGWQWIYENDPLFREIVDFTGKMDFKIRPAYRFMGQVFSGSYISPEWVKYSGHNKGPEVEKKLKYADGMHDF